MASDVCCRKLILWQYKDELHVFASILEGVAESMKLYGSKNKNSVLKMILGNRFKEFYQLHRGVRGREPLGINPTLAWLTEKPIEQ